MTRTRPSGQCIDKPATQDQAIGTRNATMPGSATKAMSARMKMRVNPNRASPDPRTRPNHSTRPQNTPRPPRPPHLPAPMASCRDDTRIRLTHLAHQRVHRTPYARRAAVQHAGANHRRLHVDVPNQLLHRPDVVTILQHVRREQVPDAVAGGPLGRTLAPTDPPRTLWPWSRR